MDGAAYEGERSVAVTTFTAFGTTCSRSEVVSCFEPQVTFPLGGRGAALSSCTMHASKLATGDCQMHPHLASNPQSIRFIGC